MTSDQKSTACGIIGALLLAALVGVFASSCSGCAQPVTASDDIEARGIAAATAALGDDKPQESAAPPQVSEPVADEHTATPQEPAPDLPKYMPPEDPEPVDSRPVMYVYSPPAAPDPRNFYCRFCEQMKTDADILPVRCVFRDAPEWVCEWVDAVKGRGYPVLHYSDGEAWRLHCGYQGAEKFAKWCGKPLLPKKSAPEVATQRPFAESWRQELSRKHGRRASAAHTDLEAETVALPTTQINLRSQCVEFSGPSRESRLNRWFSVSFGAGTVSHSGSTVEFSNPPELRFHLFANRDGEMLDSLKAIEFVSGGAKLHLTRFGSVNFRIK